MHFAYNNLFTHHQTIRCTLVMETGLTHTQCSVSDLIEQEPLREQIKLEDYVSESTGLPTLEDIIQELAKPGRDPREKFEAFCFAEGIEKVTDLEVGMKLPGIVTNVTVV